MLRWTLTLMLLLGLSFSVWSQGALHPYLPFEHRINILVERNNIIFSTVPLVFLELAGVSLFDYDDDGQLDIYLTNGPGYENSLLTGNDFTNMAKSLNLNHLGGTAPLAGDIDNDGDQDLFIARRNKNALYLNEGDGVYTNITEFAGVGALDQLTISAAFCDFDNDSFIDLYLSNRRNFEDDDRHPNLLFRNNGDLTFDEIGRQAGVDNAVTRNLSTPEQAQNTSWATACFDYDLDGDQDIAVAVDFSTITLFKNQWQESQTLTFENVTIEAGLGTTGNWMGLAIGDYNGDALLDIFATNWGTSPNIYGVDLPVETTLHALYMNNGDGTFTDRSHEAGVAAWPFGWGAATLDWENDGDLDIYFVGNMLENVNRPVWDNQGFLFLNDGNANFSEARPRYDLTNSNERNEFQVGHGVAIGDLGNDGFFEFVVANSAYRDQDHNVIPGIPRVFWNHSDLHDDPGNWLKIKLTGTQSNRDAIGTRVYVFAGDQTFVREVQSGNGHMSQSSLELGFGLGNHTIIDRLEVHWPSGLVDIRRRLPVNQSIELIEREGNN